MDDRPKIRCIDSHVHFRDWREDYKETIRGGSEKAAKQGIIAVGDMPNSIPPILSRDSVIKRLELSKKEKTLVKYFLWIGIIPKTDQIKEAVKAVREIPEVLGVKLYAGPTTNALGINNQKEQRMIYQTLTDLDYQGVLAVHCEKQSELRPKSWNPNIPWSHGWARPSEAEIEAVKDQIRFAKAINFSGRLHICHMSLPETLSIVRDAREEGLDISGEVTPHHLLLSELKMIELSMEGKKKNGLIFKVNPPLRTLPAVEKLRKQVISLVRRKEDWFWIATDYAPHTKKEKLNPPHLSGIADYSLYNQLLFRLNKEGLNWEQIEQLTCHNIVKAFGKI